MNQSERESSLVRPPPAKRIKLHERLVTESAPLWTEITEFELDLNGGGGSVVVVKVGLRKLYPDVTIQSVDVSCGFTATSFDLKVVGQNGCNFRFKKRI